MARGDGLLEVGDLVGGKYRVESILGSGGMAKVACAVHTELGERVALKFLRPGAFANREALARFSQEARAMFRLKSQHTARVFDVGTTEGGAPYIVMEFLEGHDLETELGLRTRLPVEEATMWVVQACDALAEAHALGIVHRDIKPANLFLTRRADGSRIVKVLDFGVSKVPKRDADEPSLTSVDSWMGTPRYMAPEQFRASAAADARADVWALGVVLYRAVAGVHPFPGEDDLALLRSISNGRPASPSTHCRNLPEPVARAVLRCLEHRAVDRFQSVRDLAAALQPFAAPSAPIDGAALLGASVGGSAARPVPTPLAEETPVISALPPRGRRTIQRSAFALACGGIGLVGILVVALAVRAPRSAAEPTPEVVVAPPPSPPTAPAPNPADEPAIEVPIVEPATPPTATGSTGSAPPSRVRRPPAPPPPLPSPSPSPSPRVGGPRPDQKNW